MTNKPDDPVDILIGLVCLLGIFIAIGCWIYVAVTA